MSEQIYGGYIVREYFGHDDMIYQTTSGERIFVKASGREAAELLIHEVYSKDQRRWTQNRTSQKFLGDKVFVEDLKTAEELIAEHGEEYKKSLEKRVVEV